MKNIVLTILFFVPFSTFSQDFSRQEIQNIEKVLKRSISVIREFNATSLVNGTSLISVELTGNSEIESYVENALFRSGFEVVSNQAAQDAVKVLKSNGNEIEPSNSTTYNSIYSVKVSGQYFKGAFSGKCQRALSSFTARIVDLADNGKLIGTFQFAENTISYVACGEDIGNALTFKLLESVR